MINYNYSSDNGTTCWIFKKDNCNKSVLVLGLLEDLLKNSLSCENYPWSMLLTTAGPYLVCCSSLGAVFQVVREHLTGICFSLQSIKVKKKCLVSVRFIYCHNLFGRNSGNDQTVHSSFKIQYINRLERTTKCCMFGCSCLTCDSLLSIVIV